MYMKLADLSGIRPLFLNKQAHKSHVLQHRRKGFASRVNPFNLQIISYIYFSDTSISVQVFNRSLRRRQTCNGHTERRTADIIQSHLVAELH